MCFSGSGPTHFFRWIVYHCVCIQHDIDKSPISFTELCKSLRTNSGLRAINSCLLTTLVSVNIVLWQQNLKFSFHQRTVEFGPTHIFTQIYAPGEARMPGSIYGRCLRRPSRPGGVDFTTMTHPACDDCIEAVSVDVASSTNLEWKICGVHGGQ